MRLALRTAVPEDAPAIAELFRRCFTATFGHLYDPADLASFLGSKSAADYHDELASGQLRLCLAFVGGELAGFAKLGPPELPLATPPNSIELRQFYVLEPWHGTGVASAMMDWVMAESAAAGARHLQLSVYVDNHGARRFYERYGFTAVERFPFMVGSHADEEIAMRRTLAGDA